LSFVVEIVVSQFTEMTCTRVGEICAKFASREPLPNPPSEPSGNT